MRVLIHHHDAVTWRDALAARLPGADIVTSDDDDATAADYLVAWQPPAALLQRQRQLKGIVNLGAGVDALLANPALPRAVPIVKLRDAGMATLMVDYVRYGVLHFQRNFDRYLHQEADADWRAWPAKDKADWQVTILGLGAIGRHVAQALAADGFCVHGWSRTPKTVTGVTCHHGDDALPDVLAHTDTLVTLLPDTPATRAIVNTTLLAQLADGASLINPGRGPLIDEPALLAALAGEIEGHQLRGAMLDVFPDEPLAADSALWQAPRVRVTPHISAPTPVHAAADQVADLITALDRGEPVATVDVTAGY